MADVEYLKRLEHDLADEEFETRFTDAVDMVPRIYRLMAEGAIAEAMEEMSRAFDLAPPSHEMRIAARIAAGRQKELAP